jgi:hypothetical protein
MWGRGSLPVLTGRGLKEPLCHTRESGDLVGRDAPLPVEKPCVRSEAPAHRQRRVGFWILAFARMTSGCMSRDSFAVSGDFNALRGGKFRIGLFRAGRIRQLRPAREFGPVQRRTQALLDGGTSLTAWPWECRVGDRRLRTVAQIVVFRKINRHFLLLGKGARGKPVHPRPVNVLKIPPPTKTTILAPLLRAKR